MKGRNRHNIMNNIFIPKTGLKWLPTLLCKIEELTQVGSNVNLLLTWPGHFSSVHSATSLCFSREEGMPGAWGERKNRRKKVQRYICKGTSAERTTQGYYRLRAGFRVFKLLLLEQHRIYIYVYTSSVTHYTAFTQINSPMRHCKKSFAFSDVHPVWSTSSWHFKHLWAFYFKILLGHGRLLWKSYPWIVVKQH